MRGVAAHWGSCAYSLGEYSQWWFTHHLLVEAMSELVQMLRSNVARLVDGHRTCHDLYESGNSNLRPEYDAPGPHAPTGSWTCLGCMVRDHT